LKASLLLFTGLFSICGLAFADTVDIYVPTSQPSLVLTAGQSIIYKLDELHEAALQLSHSEPYTIQSKVDIAEDLCADQYTTPACTYKLDFANDHLVLVWTKHPNVSKIGKVVQAQLNYDGGKGSLRPVDLNVGSSFTTQFLGQKPDDRFHPDEIACDRYDWLGDGFQSTTIPEKLKINIWSAELMLPNSETGISENRSYLNAEGVLFIQSNSIFKLTSIDRLISMGNASSTTLLPIGNISTLQMVNPTTKARCQISLSHDLVGAARSLNLESHYLAKPNLQNYYQDKSGTMRLFNSAFKNTLTPTNFQQLELQ
jgi:hypothetical protein